jgi:predicted O-methyltransferase YrrM
VIIIDGTEEWIHVRPTCFRLAEERVKSGGIIILDDSWRYADPRRSNKAKRVESFVSTGPCRPGVTSTDVFFY